MAWSTILVPFLVFWTPEGEVPRYGSILSHICSKSWHIIFFVGGVWYRSTFLCLLCHFCHLKFHFPFFPLTTFWSTFWLPILFDRGREGKASLEITGPNSSLLFFCSQPFTPCVRYLRYNAGACGFVGWWQFQMIWAYDGFDRQSWADADVDGWFVTLISSWRVTEDNLDSFLFRNVSWRSEIMNYISDWNPASCFCLDRFTISSRLGYNEINRLFMNSSCGEEKCWHGPVGYV